MTDREKVIKGLENCIAGCDFPPECPYLDDCNDLMKPMFVELAKDALALLKEQEPRVLTLEEVQNDCPDYVYMEIASGWIECCLKDEGDSTKSVGYFVYGFDEYFIEAWREYGKTWRCWDKRPTGEQRKEVKWDAAD